MAESFLKRWARLKSESLPDAVPAPADDTPELDGEAAEAPSMRDARLLTPDSDFSRFVAKSVDPDVRRTALKTLFTDPHFQQMDGLDIYIGDYTRPTPLPPEMVAALWHAKSTLAPRPLWLDAERDADAAPPADADEPVRSDPQEADADAPPGAAEAPEPGGAGEPDSCPEDASSLEGTPLPFNEQVNFSHGSDAHWNRPRPD